MDYYVLTFRRSILLFIDSLVFLLQKLRKVRNRRGTGIHFHLLVFLTVKTVSKNMELEKCYFLSYGGIPDLFCVQGVELDAIGQL